MLSSPAQASSTSSLPSRHQPLLQPSRPACVCVQLVYFVTVYTLPTTFVGIFTAEPLRVVKNWHPFVCVAAGLWGGLIIGLVTEYYTSNRYAPVQVLQLSQSC